MCDPCWRRYLPSATCGGSHLASAAGRSLGEACNASANATATRARFFYACIEKPLRRRIASVYLCQEKKGILAQLARVALSKLRHFDNPRR